MRFATAGLLALLSLAACGGESISAPYSAFAGRYVLQTLAGVHVPVGNAATEVTAVADTLTLSASGTWTETRISGFPDGSRKPFVGQGTFTVVGSHVTIVGDATSTSWVGDFSGNALSLTNCNAAPGCGSSYGAVYVYTK